jgi:uncharacterized membrane protein YeaQ/YmgE (transglycosylase-associated protein family)
MHPEEVEQFLTFTLPQEFEINVMAPARYFWETWLPTWWDNVAIPSWNNFWEEVFPAWWTTNVKDPIVNYFSEGGPFSAWWTANVKDPVTTFFTKGLYQWFIEKIKKIVVKLIEYLKNPVVTFIESLPGRIDTLLTVTIPNKIGFWFGYIAGQALIAFMEWPEKIIAWISETGWPTLIEWIENTGWPALRKALTFSITGWLKGELLEKVEEGLFVDIVAGIVAVFNAGWNAFQRAWESFLEGAVEGFWTALFGPGGRPEEKEPPPTEPPPTEPSEFQLGGIIRRTGQVLAHAGEVVFNPRYPRQDLARVVNSAMARAGGGGGGSSISLAPVLNIGSFSGSQAEMTQLQNMLENMSLNMTQRLERKLAEARRVENRRRE